MKSWGCHKLPCSVKGEPINKCSSRQGKYAPATWKSTRMLALPVGIRTPEPVVLKLTLQNPSEISIAVACLRYIHGDSGDPNDPAPRPARPGHGFPGTTNIIISQQLNRNHCDNIKQRVEYLPCNIFRNEAHQVHCDTG